MKYLPSLVAALIAILLAPSASAHQAFMLVQLSDDGKLVVETGFSDGSTGAGLPLILSDLATGVEIDTYAVDEDGLTYLPVPKVPYTVTFDGGPGHRLTRDGPMPDAATTARRGSIEFINVFQGDPTQLDVALQETVSRAQVIVCFERTARRLQALLSDATIVVVDDSSPLGAENEITAQLRERVVARIEEAVGAGEDVAVLVEGIVETSADWAWLSGDMK